MSECVARSIGTQTLHSMHDGDALTCAMTLDDTLGQQLSLRSTGVVLVMNGE